MTLSRILVEDFRNIEQLDVSLSPEFNIICGDNGSGKTSLLEAIYFLSHGRSFRSNSIINLIKYNKNKFTLFSQLENTDDNSIGIEKEKKGNGTLKINGNSGKKISELANILPVQLINPEGFTLLTGGPKFRRSFIDWGIFYSQPEFYLTWQKIKKLTQQRNALLKKKCNYVEFTFWDKELANLTTQLSHWRQEYVIMLASEANKLCKIFLPELSIDFSYYRGWDRNIDYLDYLKNNFKRDLDFGYTYNGSHKADLRIKIGSVAVNEVLSRGQLKLLMCALRLAQGQYLAKVTGKKSIYLIDDFASELDIHRRELLITTLVKTQAQVFVSCILPTQVISKELTSIVDSKVFHMKHGNIYEE